MSKDTKANNVIPDFYNKAKKEWEQKVKEEEIKIAENKADNNDISAATSGEKSQEESKRGRPIGL